MDDVHVANSGDFVEDECSASDESSVCESVCDTEHGEESLEIKVKQVGKGEEDVLCLRVDPKASVLDLKTEIAKLLAAKNTPGVPVDRQRLMYFGRMLRDNDQILGSDGVKMQTEVVNYVHLSPLPEGAKPSPRSNAGINIFGGPAGAGGATLGGPLQAVERSIEQSLQRARRIGAAARERRRRRRAQPYDAVSRPSNRNESGGSTSSGNSTNPEVRQSSTSISGQPLASSAFQSSSSSGVVDGQTRLPQILPLQTSVLGHALLGAGPSLLPSVPQISQTTAFPALSQALAMAAASAEARVASRVNSHLVEQAHQISSDLMPFLSIVHERLRRISTSNNLGSNELDLLETANALEHVSRETRTLSLSLRGLLETTPQSTVTSASSNPIGQVVPVPLESVLAAEGENDPAILLSPPSILLPGTWFPPMM